MYTDPGFIINTIRCIVIAVFQYWLAGSDERLPLEVDNVA